MNNFSVTWYDYNVDGACKVLEALGYRMTHRAY